MEENTLQRADVALCARGLAASRERAQALEDALGAYCRSFHRVLSDSAQENEHFTLTWEE